jgi:AraC-like DNA-binding protein
MAASRKNIRSRLTIGAWTRSPGCSTAPGPATPSCSARGCRRRGRCGSRTRPPSPWSPWSAATPGCGPARHTGSASGTSRSCAGPAPTRSPTSRTAHRNCPLIPLLADEIVKDEPGQEAVLDRLLDLLLIAVLRAWFARPDAKAPGWYRGYADPVVGPALRQIYAAPHQPWTVQSLAHAAGASRATLARRFTDLVGETPMAFLARWRIELAADLLREPHATLACVAHQVGYATPYALSIAFKRERGVSPRDYLAAAAAG